MSSRLIFTATSPSLEDIKDFAFGRRRLESIEIGPEAIERVRRSNDQLKRHMAESFPIYGVTTGLGDSCQRFVSPEDSAELQLNLVRYLGCGSGDLMPKPAARAVLMIHLKTLARGLSGVRPELLERMRCFLERDWIPVIPREGSLGASGDLVPLSYIARTLCGDGEIYGSKGEPQAIAPLLQSASLPPFVLGPKEGLSLVNGVSAMAGASLVNLNRAEALLDVACVASSWLCLALGGRTESFGTLVNERAKKQRGQALVAREVRTLLEQESYASSHWKTISVQDRLAQSMVQDRYSLRCVPQILGPVWDTLEQSWAWLGNEVSAVSDNPLLDEEGEMASGGNFYGGYLGHSMDYTKICVAQIADLMDRQVMLIVDEKSNRGLPPNLAAWPQLGESQRHLHHGLKGLHQAASAITSEIMAKATPNTIFSRSSESHNQDKISLGMSAANQCADLLGQSYRLQALQLVCLAQALDLRGVKLRGERSMELYDGLRQRVPFVDKDRALHRELHAVESWLHSRAEKGEGEILKRAHESL